MFITVSLFYAKLYACTDILMHAYICPPPTPTCYCDLCIILKGKWKTCLCYYLVNNSSACYIKRKRITTVRYYLKFYLLFNYIAFIYFLIYAFHCFSYFIQLVIVAIYVNFLPEPSLTEYLCICVYCVCLFYNFICLWICVYFVCVCTISPFYVCTKQLSTHTILGNS